MSERDRERDREKEEKRKIEGKESQREGVSEREREKEEKEKKEEGNVLFNDALNTFYLRLYGAKHMVKHHSDNERENPLAPHGLLFPISSKGSFICIIPERG